MNDDINCWLILEKSDDTRVSKGIDSYRDKTGQEYHYDSFVPNHKNLKGGDLVVVRKEKEIIGLGVIRSIDESTSIKVHRRCPACDSTDIRERKTKAPKWKCGSSKCGKEFAEEKKTRTEVRAYVASIENFKPLKEPPSVQAVKTCSIKGDGVKSQLSILQLDAEKLRKILRISENQRLKEDQTKKFFGQGYELSYEERRAVEMHSMKMAIELYEHRGWTVEDKSQTCPYDLLAKKGREKRFIEVKGTTGDGSSIILTHGEVRHVDEHSRESALVVVSGIKLTKQDDGWIAHDGVVCSHQDPWKIKESLLQATEFRYEVQ